MLIGSLFYYLSYYILKNKSKYLIVKIIIYNYEITITSSYKTLRVYIMYKSYL